VATKNPTNLKNHLPNHHEDVYKELEAREKEEKDAKKRMKTEGL
jgi:cation transport regulator ChaB